MRRWISRLGLGLVVVLVVVLGGCAALPPLEPPQALFRDALFAPPSLRIDAAEALAISPAMKTYLVEKIAIRANSDDRRIALIDALYRQGAL